MLWFFRNKQGFIIWVSYHFSEFKVFQNLELFIIWKRKSNPPKKSGIPNNPVFWSSFFMKKLDFIKKILKGFCFKRFFLFLVETPWKKTGFAFGREWEKIRILHDFSRIQNVFERVFALNNVFSFLEKIMFWGEHLTKITCQIKFFSNLQWHRPKKSRFLKSLFLKIYKNLKNMHRESILKLDGFLEEQILRGGICWLNSWFWGSIVPKMIASVWFSVGRAIWSRFLKRNCCCSFVFLKKCIKDDVKRMLFQQFFMNFVDFARFRFIVLRVRITEI